MTKYDLVSRPAVMSYIRGYVHEIITESGKDKNEHTNRVLRAIMKDIIQMPVTDPVLPGEAHWTKIEPTIYECSNCGVLVRDVFNAINHYRYCMYCGCFMNGNMEAVK